MNENSLDERLKQLKEEQAQAKEIYRKRKDLGLLDKEPQSIQDLAQAILDREEQIADIQSQIHQNDKQDSDIREYFENEQETQETSLIQYSRNPVLRWLEKIINKLEKISQKIDQDIERLNNKKKMSPRDFDDLQEYRDIVNIDFSKNYKQQNQSKKSWELDPEQVKEQRMLQVEIAQKYNERRQGVQTTERGQDISK